MAQKRPPLPIFNKNKRPRQALVAHPNNGALTQPTQRNYHQPQRPFHSGSSHVTYNQSQLPKNRSSYNCHAPSPSSQGQENTTSPYHATQPYGNVQPRGNIAQPYGNRQPYGNAAQPHGNAQPYGNVSYEQAWQRENSIDYPKPASDSSSKQHHQFVRPPPASQRYTTRPKVPAQVSVASTGSVAVGSAKEPSREMAAQHSSQGKSFKRKPTLRVLTATAQGMKHWSKYKNNSPLMFEVLGRLSSPTTLVRGQTKCKQFQLTTEDGPVQCIFWEMARCLPPLVRGHLLRVVGQWEHQDEIMKCFSVREANEDEAMAYRKAVEVSDRTMRQYVAEIQH